MNTNQSHFQFEELPKAKDFRLPKFQAAVRETIEDHQVPEKMAYYIASAACDAAAQTLSDVEKPKGGTVGIGTFTVIGAKSGERKTTVDKDFFGAFIEVDNEIKAKSVEQEEKQKGELKMWTLRERALNAKYVAAVKAGEETSGIEDEIKAHDAKKPAPESGMQLVFKDATIQAIKKGMNNMPCITLLSSDSWKLLNEMILPNDAEFCQIWSDEPINVSRVTADSYTVTNPRLSKCLMIQPDKLATIMSGRGKESIGSGYMARIVFSDVGSTQGTRMTKLTPTSRTHREAFKNNIKELLLEYIEAVQSGSYLRTPCKFSPDAAHIWFNYFDYVEYEMREGGRYYNATDHASKLADNVARKAAAFHLTERFEGDIGADCVLAAIALCNEASKDYMTHIVPKDQLELDAMELYAWLIKWIKDQASKGIRIKINHDHREISIIANYCHNRFRGKNLRPLLGYLKEKGLVRLWLQPTSPGKGREMVDLTPQGN